MSAADVDVYVDAGADVGAERAGTSERPAVETPAATAGAAPVAEPPVPPSVRRARRAVAARHLLALHAEGALAEPARWDWDTLGELPSWTLLGETERQALQCAAGLVFLGPELCRLVDGAALRTLGETVGRDTLERVLDDAAARFGDAASTADAAPPDAAAWHARAVGTGASVLHATLGYRLEAVLPLDALRASTGEPLGTLDRATAERVLIRAETLLRDAAESGAVEASGERR